MNKLYVVGIGPGAYEDMTVRAVKTLEDCQVIAGYTVYVDLVRKYFPEKEFLTTPGVLNSYAPGDSTMSYGS